MFIVLKKYNIILSVCIAFVLGLSIKILSGGDNSAAVSAIPGFNKTVIVDAGHGSPDGGAQGNDGTLEKDLNLKISAFLQEFLEQGGANVLITRADDEGIYDENAKDIKQKKRTDIKNREKLMNKSDADVFVSIHMNKFPEEKYSGPQVFHSKSEKSKLLAELVQKRLNDNTDLPKKREIKQAGSEIYLLKKAEVPAILVECGFLSNKAELELLKREEYQKSVAWAIYCGICDYFAQADT